MTSRYEFAKTRGMIHGHAMAYTKTAADKELSDLIHEWAVASFGELEKLDDHLMDDSTKSKMEHLQSCPEHPGSPFEQNGGFKKHMKKVEDYLTFEAGGRHMWDTYNSNLAKLKVTAEKAIGECLSAKVAYSAMHPGVAHSEWLGPPGPTSLGYAGISAPVMERYLTTTDVLEKDELKKFKFDREGHLYCRRVNITNHCFLHACSEYCWRDYKVAEVYDPGKHQNPTTGKDIPNVVGTFSKPIDGIDVKHAWVRTKHCRFQFGYQLGPRHGKFKDRTGGKEHSTNFRLSMNSEGVAQFECKRNHHRIVQEPLMCMHFGANNDMQRFITHSTPYSQIPNFDQPGQLEKFYTGLNILGMPGLLRAFASDRCSFYCTGYCCKGAQSSREWSKVLEKITRTYVDPSNGNKSVRSVVSKFMNEISAKRSVPADEAKYILAGGKVTSNTMEVRFCSVSEVRTEDLPEQVTETYSKNSFTFAAILKAYKSKGQLLKDLNVYKYAAMHHGNASKGNPIVPAFMGFNDKPSWPLDEAYSRMMLLLFKPWNTSVEELRHNDGTFATALEEYMYDPNFPQRITIKILQRKLNWKPSLEADLVDSEQHNSTPSSPRELNSQDEEAVALAAGLAPEDYQDPDSDGDLSQGELEQLPDPSPDYDWSQNYKEGAETWLETYKDKFYEAQTNATGNDSSSHDLDLFTPALYRPDNARGYHQRMLIGCLLYQLYVWHRHMSMRQLLNPPYRLPDDFPKAPESLFVYIQGNPGAGKTFCGRTMINMVRCVFGMQGKDKAIAPTGCAASLLNGATCARGIKIPVGNKAKEQPSDNYLPNKSDELRAFALSLCKLFALFKDEHSMDSRGMWAWMRHRLESARKYEPGLDQWLHRSRLPGQKECYERLMATTQFDLALQELSERPFSGIPFIASLGDCQQLPPVGAKSHYDTSKAYDADLACAAGRLAFSDFLNPPEGSNCRGVTIVMEEVRRQEPGPFMTSLSHMRDGTVTVDDAKFLLQRQWSKLSEQEQDLFEKNALFLFPQWKRTKPITIKYLKGLDRPIAKIISRYSYNKINHAKKDVNLPALLALCVSARVMLLHNFLVERDLKNGSMGTVIDIVYKEPMGPLQTGALPLYVVVEFPNCTIPSDEAWDPDHPKQVPIPVKQFRCEKRCCSQTTVPLRICKAISIYKSQGITVGKDNQWEYVVVGMPDPDSRHKSSGQELVAFSRAQTETCLAIAEDIELTMDMFTKIGKSNACEKKRKFEKTLKDRQEASQQWIKDKITDLDNTHNDGQKTFDGGYEFLCRWYSFYHNRHTGTTDLPNLFNAMDIS